MPAPKGNQYAKGCKTSGQPTKYRPEYCEAIVEHMKEGASATSFAASIGVSRETISNWCDEHKEFFVAFRNGKAACAAWWEHRLRDASVRGGGPGASTATIFGLKNMAPQDWNERVHITATGKDDGPIEVDVKSDAAERLVSLLDGLASNKQ